MVRIERHEAPQTLDCVQAWATPAAHIRDKILVVKRHHAELALGQPMSLKEGGDIVEQGDHALLMGEISPTVNSGRGIFRECHRERVPCDTVPMGDIHAIREAIEREMKLKGFSRRSLSAAAGLSESAVRDLLTRTSNPGIDTLRKVAEAMEMPVDALTGAGLTVPVLGKIGAGGQILFATDFVEEGDLPSAPRPPLVVGRLMALEVVGSSMLPKYEAGDIVYVRRDHEGILPSYIGKYCAVRTIDGGTFLKLLGAGGVPDRYTLRSLNAEDMTDVEIEWASPVLFVMPKQAE